VSAPTPDQDAIPYADARRIARTLNPRQSSQLRAIVARDRAHGWNDMRINRALYGRSLVLYTHLDGEIIDVNPTTLGRAVLEALDILAEPDAYTGPELGTAQEFVLHSLNEINNGVWWPGCGWSWGTPAATVRVLDSLELRGLAVRSATTAGDPKFEITAMGRNEIRPAWRKILDARARRKTDA
jgi:hypothetical protein